MLDARLPDGSGNHRMDALCRVAAGQSLIDPTLTAGVLERLRHHPAEHDELASLNASEPGRAQARGDHDPSERSGDAAPTLSGQAPPDELDVHVTWPRWPGPRVPHSTDTVDLLGVGDEVRSSDCHHAPAQERLVVIEIVGLESQHRLHPNELSSLSGAMRNTMASPCRL